MANVSIQHVSKIYSGEKGREVTAVRDFSLEIPDREFTVFVGPSGCGKSTMLRMIAGLEEISKGDIFIDGVRVNDVPPKDRDIAMVFQNYALYPHMTVYENLAFGLKLRGVGKVETDERVRDAARVLGIEALLERKPKELSGGQRQRVAVGRAIVRQPKVFLFDEPLSNLDAKMRMQMRTEIIKLHQRLASTMIYVTHDQVEAMTMGDRIVVMSDGLIQQADAPLDIYHKPGNLFVAGFLGSPAMNLIHGEVKARDGRLWFCEADGGSVELLLEGRAETAPYAGKELVLGIRPEEVAVSEDSRRGFKGVIDVVEPMGAETNVYLHTGAHAVVSRGKFAGSPRKIGGSLWFEIDLAKAHFFDPQTTARIAP
ncbi:MAG: ABC transporter ATP-binding protein [Chthoniobacteraceae bacterium]